MKPKTVMVIINDDVHSGLLLAWQQNPETKVWRGLVRFNRDNLNYEQWFDESDIRPLDYEAVPVDAWPDEALQNLIAAIKRQPEDAEFFVEENEQ